MPDDLLGEAVNEIIDQFNAVAWYKDAAEGYWQQGGKLFRDNLGLLVVDVPDTAKNRKWMKAYKARWKERLSAEGSPVDRKKKQLQGCAMSAVIRPIRRH